jgi:hypothetical protein
VSSDFWVPRLIVFDDRVHDVSNLRMHATMITLAGFPADLSRWANDLITGFQRMAVSAAMYSTDRTSARPPQTNRFP